VKAALEKAPDAAGVLAVFEGEGGDNRALDRIFGEELPSGLVLAADRPLSA